MNRKLKRLLTLTVLLGFASFAKAAVTDQLVITITPNAFYSVQITTVDAALDLGTVALGVSTQTVIPATVTIQSTYATTDLRLQGAITSGGTPWTFDDNTTSTEANKLASWATFTSTSRSSAPVQGGDYFEGTQDVANSDVISTANNYVGTSVVTGADRYENESSFDLVDMDALVPTTQSHLWFRFRLPSATSTNNAQNITITLTAVATN